MPRQKRKISKSSTYHVIVRGNERKKIFLDDEDHIKFIDILYNKIADTKSVLYAFCLMDNHVHMIINECSGNISAIMQKINLCYACHFNKKYRRVGHLFQDRFKSEVIEDDSYLLTAIRYVHNNPVKANIADNPNDYRWSSCSAYFSGNQELLPLQTDYILEIFSKDKPNAIEKFVYFSNISNDDEFIELPEDIRSAKSIFTVKDAQEFIQSYLSDNKLNIDNIRYKSNKVVRNKLINYLKETSTLTINQIADILSIDRNIVQRA